jgi:hypothetical protein
MLIDACKGSFYRVSYSIRGDVNVVKKAVRKTGSAMFSLVSSAWLK